MKNIFIEPSKNKSFIVIFFLFIFIFLLIWSLFGIDMTDEGKQMSISWSIFHNHNHSYNIYKYGSWVINGLWLNVIEKPFLLWERVGGVILMTLMTLFAYLINRKYLNNNFTLFVLVVSFMFIICENHPETKIDHSNLPTLLAMISVFFFLLYVRPEMDFNGNILFNILSSLFMLISIFSRVTHILFLLFPLIFFLIGKIMFNISWKKVIQSILYYYLSILILIIIGFVYYKFKSGNNTGMIRNIFSYVFGLISFEKIKELNIHIINNPSELRKISYAFFLLHKYIRDSIYIFSLMIFLLIGIICFNILYEKYNKKLLKNKYIEYSFYVFIGTLLFLFLFLKPWIWYMATYGFIFAFLIIILTKKISLKNEFFYLFWGILFIYISFLGSNNGYRHSVPSGAIFILLSMVGLINYKRKNDLINKKLIFLNKFTHIFFIVLLLFSFTKKIVNDNKRDVQPIFSRNTMFKSPELFGIFSSNDRVEAIDGIMEAVKKYTARSDLLMCVNSVPIFHYLLNRDYFLSDPWIEQINLGGFKFDLENKAARNIFPDYIIFSKRSAREDNWPNTNVIYEPSDKEKYEFIINYINIHKFENIFENNAFILYKIQNK